MRKMDELLAKLEGLKAGSKEHSKLHPRYD